MKYNAEEDFTVSVYLSSDESYTQKEKIYFLDYPELCFFLVEFMTATEQV